ncbi:amino acid ABC transporter permease [Taklimakanibacter deserti]|uniref:amino acid ABC transporter permease n=1 Tax=Taklimakanibacter deserti TaxID=2267839 RepID=UPI000E651F67
MLHMSFGANDIIFMLKGAGVTLAITFWSVAFGTLLGLCFGVVRSEGPWHLSAPLGFFLDIFRSVPLLIQFVLFNAANSMFATNLPVFAIACVVLAIYTASYCTEIVRAGILAVPQTTRRAARSLGLSYFQDLTNIVFPIALKVALPNWISLTLGVMKDTSLVLWIGITELLRASQTIITRTQEPLLVLAIAGAIYFAMSFPLGRLGMWLERKWTAQ